MPPVYVSWSGGPDDAVERLHDFRRTGRCALAADDSDGTAADRAGQPRLAVNEDCDQRDPERRGDVDEPGVDADDERGAGNHRRDRIEGPAIRHVSVRAESGSRRNGLAADALRRGAPWQHHVKIARTHAARHGDPIRLRPQLAVLGSPMNEQRIWPGGSRARDHGAVESVIEGMLRIIAERETAQGAVAQNGMGVPFDAMANVVERAGERLANAGAAVAVADSANGAGNQRTAQQALRVNSRRKRPRPQGVAKTPNLPPCSGG